MQTALKRKSNNNVKEGSTVYRGIAKCKFDKQIKIGDEFFYREFMSTSYSLDVAKQFVGNEGGTILIITINNNGTNKYPNYCSYLENITKVKGEKEVLLSALSRFKIKEIQ